MIDSLKNHTKQAKKLISYIGIEKERKKERKLTQQPKELHQLQIKKVQQWRKAVPARNPMACSLPLYFSPSQLLLCLRRL